MISDQFSPEEQSIIQQIQAVPKLELSASARDAIRGRMLNEFRAVNQASAATNAARTRLIVLTTAAIVVITIIVIIVFVIISRQNDTSEVLPSTPINLTVSHAAPLQSASPTNIPHSPTIKPSATRTPTPTKAVTKPAPSSTASPLPPSETPIPATQAEVHLTETSTDQSPISQPTADSTQEVTSVIATLTPETIVVIDGPVTNIANNIITIYDFDIEVEANHPILNLIEVGDTIHVEGTFGEGDTVSAQVVSNDSDVVLADGASVSLDGPVESINGALVVVNGITVQLAANDPLLQTIQVGQFVSVQGNFQGSGANIVLVVVTVVVNTNVTITDSACWFHENGMSGMGHWHCDGNVIGMGMGNEAMGMGNEGMGMGMGP